MLKSNTPACVRAQVRYNRCVAPGELLLSVLVLSSAFSPSVKYLFVSADALRVGKHIEG